MDSERVFCACDAIACNKREGVAMSTGGESKEEGRTKGGRVVGPALAFLVVVLLLMLLAPASVLASFPDVPFDHPYAGVIADLANREIVTGYADGRFGPNDFVYRQQFAKMIVRTMEFPVSEAAWPNPSIPFADLGPDILPGPGVNDSLYPHEYVAVCALAGITNGTSPTAFSPWGRISRAQLITMVTRAAGVGDPGSYVPSFGNFDPTHYPWARRAEYAGLLDGLQGVGPSYDFWRFATRGEVCQVLYNLSQYDLRCIERDLADTAGIPDDFEVVSYHVEGDWAGVIIDSEGAGVAFLLMRWWPEGWSIEEMGTGLSYQDWEDAGAPGEIAEFLAAGLPLGIIWDAIDECVDVDFEIRDYLIRGWPQWAGVIIGSPGLDDCAVLLKRTGRTIWTVVDFGTGYSQQDWLDMGAPLELARFLSPWG